MSGGPVVGVELPGDELSGDELTKCLQNGLWEFVRFSFARFRNSCCFQLHSRWNVANLILWPIVEVKPAKARAQRLRPERQVGLS